MVSMAESAKFIGDLALFLLGVNQLEHHRAQVRLRQRAARLGVGERCFEKSTPLRRSWATAATHVRRAQPQALE